MMEMQSASIENLLAAKVAARKAFKPLEQTGYNPHFKSNYSTLGDILNSCTDALAANDLDVCHQMFCNGQGTECVATLYHKTGEFMRSSLPVPSGTSQQIGSSVTYMRRYTLQALLGLEGDPESEDDGEATRKGEEKESGKYISADDVKSLQIMVDEVGADKNAFCNHLDVSSLDTIPAAKLDAAVAALNKKAAVTGASTRSLKVKEFLAELAARKDK